MKQLQKLTKGLAIAVVALSITGCKTANQRDTATPFWKKNDVAGTGKEFTKIAEKNKDNKDTIIWRLGQGTALRAEGKYQESQTAFEQAEDKIGRYEEMAKVRVSNELGALMTTQDNLPYEGRDYDKVMISTYKALNYLQLGQPDKARPEMNHAYQRQQDAVENNKKRIAKEEEAIKAEAEKREAEKASKSAEAPGEKQEKPTAKGSAGAPAEKKANAKANESAEKARQDPKFSQAVTNNYGNLDTLKAYADYVNPFPVYLDGVYFMNFSTGGSDLERARKSFERTLALSGDNKFVQADMAAAEGALRGEPIPPSTYIIFETGCAPWRDQIRIDIPLFFFGQGNVPYAGAAFPLLKREDSYLPSLSVSAGGLDETTLTLASMDSVVGQSFKNELPTIITKTLLSTTMKAAAAYGINKAASNQDPTLGIIMKIITALLQASVNIADLRTWTTLPKEFQVCRIPTPTNHMVTLSAPGTTQRVEVKVEPNSVNLIYVKAINATSPLIVTQAKLK